MNMNTEYVTRMQAQLKQWDDDVDALAAEGEKASAEVRASYHEQLKALRASREVGQKTFQAFRVAGESAGAQMQAGLEGAWMKMQDHLAKLTADLRK
jgi:2-oxo-4-hydroxy-4-carboxy--5-ureidoimidazoline (OHCU) decarboxylase